MAGLLLIILNLVVTLIFFKRDDKQNFLFFPYLLARKQGIRGWLYSHLSHANWAHFLFNMITLFFFAPVVESNLGAPILLLIYVASGFGADVAVFLMHRNNPRYACLGASGSVSGVLFASILLRPDMIIYVFFAIPIPAPLFAVGYLALSFYLAKRGDGSISHEAHIGGALVGFLLAVLLSPTGFQPMINWLTF